VAAKWAQRAVGGQPTSWREGTWKGFSPTTSTHGHKKKSTGQFEIAEVTTAVARGGLSRKITVDVKGRNLELKNTLKTNDG